MTSLLDRREKLLGPNVPTFYETPVHLVRGEGVWLWDADGKRYLDCYNNVPHVGHCNPHVVKAIIKQASTLNTHTRYLHESILDYTERLTATFDHDLTQAIMVCSGSEANDIALRMAQAVTGKTGIIATDATYHGNTAAVSQLSTRRPPIGGYADHIALVPAPDGVMTGETFADHISDAIQSLKVRGHGLSGLILCPVFANEGLPDVAPGFLDAAEKVVRDAGGLILCDEVQPGFGRLGSHFWGHDWMGLTPDIVTIGKPMANGHPVAAVISRPDVMEAFRTAFGYFNTFGGNPVSMAAAMATLQVIENEGLQQNALDVGAYVKDRLSSLDHPSVHGVRGLGLFVGLELVDEQGNAATAFCTRVVEAVKARGVLLNKIGKGGNILKIRPPLPIAQDQADIAIDAIEGALVEVSSDVR
jgi:4-aminobutyrate aminotransferase-like enzyme